MNLTSMFRRGRPSRRKARRQVTAPRAKTAAARLAVTDTDTDAMLARRAGKET